MDKPTFLDRRTFGITNYLAIAMVAMLVIAFIPRGTRKALESNTNNAEDWLPKSYNESVELDWFRKQFGSEAFVIMSWEGCTLGNTDQLETLARKLRVEPLTPAMAKAVGLTPHADRRIFARVVTGPEMLEDLVRPPTRLEPSQAIERMTGAFVGPPAVEGDDGTRTTCLMAYLGQPALKNNRTMRMAVERVVEIATEEVGIPRADLHMGGPPVDNVSIDIEGERTLAKLAGLSGLVGMVLAYACFRSVRLTALVLVVGIFSAGASLAMVFYFGAFEVLLLGSDEPRLGKLDAILMSMPAVVYVLGLSGAIHMINYYRDAEDVGGRRGAVERAVKMALMPCGLAAFTTAIGLASLATSDILPIEKFGVFSAIGVMLSLILLFTIVPVVLHRYPPPATSKSVQSHSASLPKWARSSAEWICQNHAWVSCGAVAIMVLFALGLPRIHSSVKLIELLHEDSTLVQDYSWLEQHLGNLVPMEVVVAVPPEMRREVNEHPEASGKHYAMTTIERMAMIRRVAERMEALGPVSRTLNASTFAPGEYDSESLSNRRTHDYIVSQAIDDNREALREFLRWEKSDDKVSIDRPRELWRATARVAALADVDYGQFVDELRVNIEPVLAAYRGRSQLVAALAAAEKQLEGARLVLLVPTEFTSNDVLFADLLREAGIENPVGGRRGKLHVVPAETLDNVTDRVRQQLTSQDAIVTCCGDIATKLTALELPHINLSNSSAPSKADVIASYTGVMPVVYKTQRQLIVSLQESLVMSTVLISIVLMVLFRGLGAGLAAMIPNLFPLVVIFGALGWLNVSVDIGIMMTASVALGVAVDDTIHFVSWFRRGITAGMSRYDAVMEAYERCGTAMVQTTLVAGLGLAVFAVSTFTPTQQFGYMMVIILVAALVGDLILLPALLIGPVGAWFPAGRPVSEEVREVLVATSGAAIKPVVLAAEAPIEEGQPAMVVETSSADALSSLEQVSSVEQPKPEVRRPEPTIPAPHTELSPASLALREKLRRFRRDQQA
ncbi:efflux RND transporter permease subunit [Aeoliella sp. SH292]|uniref:efflux RND transporter permease subunit n=1 Tax=Aeoliella sp. SH292 TaxID=3454464 RepID=UPI003F94951F